MTEPKPTEPAPIAEDKPAPEPPKKAKRPYIAPKITPLGSVKDLTLAGGSDAIADSVSSTFKVTP